MLVLDIVSVFFAVYGVYAFTSQYTCILTKPIGPLNRICKKWLWMPSACIVLFALGMLIFRSAM